MGVTLMEVLRSVDISMPYPVLVARVNNAFKSLGYRIYKPVTVEFLDVRSFEGYRVYQRTISCIVHKAVRDL
jgi:uridine kinase